MTVVVITPPAAPIIDVTTARARLGVDASVSDLTLAALIGAATAMLDGPAGTLGRAILPQTLEWRSANWAPRHDYDWGSEEPRFLYSSYGFGWGLDWHWHRHRAIELAFPPVVAVLSVSYIDTTGTPQTLDPSTYTTQVDGDITRLLPVYGTTWPPAEHYPDSIKIRYTAGYQTVPPGLLQAVLMMARNLASLGGRDAFARGEQVTGVGSTSYDTSAAAGAATMAAIDGLLAPYRVPSL